MKVLQSRPVTLLITLMTLIIIGVYAVLRIPSKEGFNPSDDGVVLAQSYRIIKGEVPHRDFISIRPAGSAIMHAVHFVSPLPLELSARWMVLIEYLLYSIFVTLILIGSWFSGLRRQYYYVLFSGSVLLMFILNQNHYNLFPWTTIDALFWFSLALYAWFRLKGNPSRFHLGWQILVFLGVSGSVLCRQTFALPGILLVARLFFWEFWQSGEQRRATSLRLVSAVILGFLPGWLYAGMLTYTGSWPDFFMQMTGRTELWQTGVVRFYAFFWHSPLPVMFGIGTLMGLIRIWNSESGKDNSIIDLFILILKLVSLLIKTVLVFAVFFRPDSLFSISLAFFWILILDIFLVYLHEGQIPKWIHPAFWVLLAAWTSAISLGDNAPVFALGWLAGTAILVQIKDFWTRFYRRVKNYQLAVSGLLIVFLFVLSVVVQSQKNYRDLPSGQLTHKGEEVFPELSGIRLSQGMFDYLSEIERLYRDFGSPKGRFVVWPNNALLYPLLDSRNPFPLDWMQAAEFAGNEQRVMEITREIMAKEDLYILVEKNNVKWIASDTIPVDHLSDDYPYLRLLDTLARQVSSAGNRFNVYRTK